MKLEIMKKWVRALRSGKFRQYKGGALRGHGGYCCLGVLCELHRTTTKTRLKWEGDQYGGRGAFPLQAVLTWAGLANSNPELLLDGVDDKTADAAGMNDSGKTFKTIADAIVRTQKARKLR